jgi:uncharacterized protein YgbK (DUF1537 family)
MSWRGRNPRQSLRPGVADAPGLRGQPMETPAIRKDVLLGSLPPEPQGPWLAKIRERLQQSRTKVVVLDDDPTGTQTVHNVPVLTEWSIETLRRELLNEGPEFFILTNSRSMSLPAAEKLNTEIGVNLARAADLANRPFVVISRSDSTLRGHFPGEVDALAKALNRDFDACLIIPFFPEGGRYTVNDIHYVADGEQLIPAGLTEFARDASFAYRASNLREWVEEKTAGRVAAASVASVSLEDIRRGGPERVTERLMRVDHGRVCVVNAMSYADLEAFTVGLLDAEAQGKRFLYRTAASMARVRAGIAARPLLTAQDLDMPVAGGGLAVVGSHVARSSAQLQELLALPGLVSTEVKVDALLEDRRRADEIGCIAAFARAGLRRRQDVLLYTSRDLLKGSDSESSLAVSSRVSSGLVEIVQGIAERPRFIVGKGGITSSDLATKALGIRRAEVLGQILPGVPVWRLGSESKYPGIPYVVFPGNVGGPRALADVFGILRKKVSG